jgi:hypothetical protein
VSECTVRVITKKRFEYAVATEPYFATYKELDYAVTKCQDEMGKQGVKVAEDNPRFTVGDGEIIVYFETEEQK